MKMVAIQVHHTVHLLYVHVHYFDKPMSLQVAILCGHHKVSGEISAFDLSQIGKYDFYLQY